MTTVSTECSGWRKFTEPVANHIFCDIHGHMLPPVMDGYGVADHFWKDGGTAGPSLDNTFFIFIIHNLNFVNQLFCNIGTLLKRPGQFPATSFPAFTYYAVLQ
jgi:hypothetical protein